ncbi:hypothetical protein TNCT_489481 [Trichonephila clavata]|uniref:Uncharacterized protein n=1 Tax=Trichonephila clavata TaxID=2740835 RepID=A0A8X6L8K5_TRICU|nr:hypothetical protein TNCT_489481 [Trichonephila clavata]
MCELKNDHQNDCRSNYFRWSSNIGLSSLPLLALCPKLMTTISLTLFLEIRPSDRSSWEQTEITGPLDAFCVPEL